MACPLVIPEDVRPERRAACECGPGATAEVTLGVSDELAKSLPIRQRGQPDTDGRAAISYFDQPDLPFYYWLASTFALNDRHFASVRSGTYPNRTFMMFGTADGVRNTGLFYPRRDTPSLVQALERAGYTWGAYSDGWALSGSLGWNHNRPGCHCPREFWTRSTPATCPTWRSSTAATRWRTITPSADRQVGEAWVREIYEHAVHSPHWPRLAILWTYDEGGEYFDHVPPPPPRVRGTAPGQGRAVLRTGSAHCSRREQPGVAGPLRLLDVRAAAPPA